ncbi:CYTH and CHAD domain-containing protein [Vibrio sp. RC27]
METEIELKFFVSPDYSDTLLTIIKELKVLQHSCRQLGNIYFDTSDSWLRQHDIGMRIRRCDDVYVQTVKTSGRVVAGLHQRPEYNAEHDGDIPNLSLHPEDIWPQGKSVSQLEHDLIPMFATDFTREQWLVMTPDGSQVEVAFDQGEVISGDQRDTICEVELELKSGQTDALFTLARSLSESGGARLGNLSKAARGYRLASGYQSDEVTPLSLVKTHSTDTVESCFIKSLEHGLSHWSYHEQIYVEHEGIEALDEIRHAICFIRQTLAVYGGVVPRRASAIIRQELKWLEQEIGWLKENDYLDDLLKEKGHVLRKLDERKSIVQHLHALQEKHPSRDDNLKLLHSGRYAGVIIDLSRWILAKGWQPFLDEKAKVTMAQPVPEFAVQQLEYVLDELCIAFPLEEALSSEMCIAQKYNLTRILYTGIGFASLYDADARNNFRLPWADLLQGIDDLLALTILRGLVDKLEDQDQLTRWLSRQEASILYAMEQTRAKGMSAIPYWHPS